MDSAGIELLIEASIRSLETLVQNVDTLKRGVEGSINGLKDLGRAIRSAPVPAANSGLTDAFAGLLQGGIPQFPFGNSNTASSGAEGSATGVTADPPPKLPPPDLGQQKQDLVTLKKVSELVEKAKKQSLIGKKIPMTSSVLGFLDDGSIKTLDEIMTMLGKLGIKDTPSKRNQVSTTLTRLGLQKRVERAKGAEGNGWRKRVVKSDAIAASPVSTTEGIVEGA